MSEPRVGRVGFFAPDWPPERFANGIVTYTGSMRLGLGQLGVKTLVLSADLASDVRTDDVIDIKDALKARSSLERARDALWRRVDPRGAAVSRAGRSLARTLRAVHARTPCDLFEIEESLGFGISALGTGIPTIVRLHGPWFLNGAALGVPRDRDFRRRDANERRLVAAADAISAPSQDVLNRVRDHFGLALENACVVPNPAPEPAERWSSAACEPHSLLFVGRFDRHKGGDLVIDAFRELARDDPQTRLYFVGPDRGLELPSGGRTSLPEYLASRVSEARIRERIEVLGPLPHPEVERMRARAGVVVVASRYEVLPLTAIEALSAGCPLVAPDAGGIPEIVEHGRSGLCFVAGDAQALASRLRILLRDRELAAQLGAEARRVYAQRFTPAAVASQALEFYATVRGRGSRPGGR